MTSSPPAKPFDWSNLAKRVISAAVLIPIALGAVWLGGWWLMAVTAVATCFLAREWALMCAPDAPIRAATPMAAAVVLALVWAQLGYFKTAWALVPLGGLAAALFALLRGLAKRPADEAFGAIYLGAPTVALIWLRSGEAGLGWTVTLMAVAWSADSAAFIAGSALKGPKLWPRFSPNKTWSGFVAGLIAGIVAAEAIAVCLPQLGGPPHGWALIVGVVAGLATMAGDLWESMLKRRFGVKDAGSLIPGHGGLLDRVDGLMFAVLAVSAARLLLEIRR